MVHHRTIKVLSIRESRHSSVSLMWCLDIDNIYLTRLSFCVHSKNSLRTFDFASQSTQTTLTWHLFKMETVAADWDLTERDVSRMLDKGTLQLSQQSKKRSIAWSDFHTLRYRGNSQLRKWLVGLYVNIVKRLSSKRTPLQTKMVLERTTGCQLGKGTLRHARSVSAYVGAECCLTTGKS